MFLNTKPKLLARPQEVEDIKEKEVEVSIDVPIHTIENLKENISSGTLLVFKEPSFLLPPPEPPDDFLNFEPNLVMKNVMLNEDFYQSKKTLSLNVEDVNSFTFIIWIFLPHFTYPEESPLIFSFRSENFVFDPGIVTFHKPVLPMRYGYIKNHKKTVKNGQARTRESEEYKRSQRFKAEARKVKPQSNPVKMVKQWSTKVNQ
ncbi:hypothetical protein Tco_0464829 [Tanacetum coccineum]